MRPNPRLAVVILASFLAGGLVPQAALVVHDHADGASPHVHAGPLVPHHHDDGPAHVHGEDDHGGPGLALPHHVHTQHPFLLADGTPPPAPRHIVCVDDAPPMAQQRFVARAVAAARSRGPPPHLAS
jgi:hypothetical protein